MLHFLWSCGTGKGDAIPVNPGQLIASDLSSFPGTNGRFWYVSSSGLVCSDGETPEDFFLELREQGRVAIKGKNGKYLRGDQGGTLKGDGDAVDSSSLWEY